MVMGGWRVSLSFWGVRGASAECSGLLALIEMWGLGITGLRCDGLWFWFMAQG